MSNNIPLQDAQFSDLRAFAESRGLEVKMPCNANQVRSKILAAFPDTTEIPGVSPAQQAVAAAEEANAAFQQPAAAFAAETAAMAAAAVQTRPDIPRCTIILQSTKDGPKNVDVSVNGKTYLMNVGVEVEVPYFVELALRNAKETRYELHQENARDRPEMVPSVSLLYPYSVVEPASKADIASWEAWSNNQFAPE